MTNEERVDWVEQFKSNYAGLVKLLELEEKTKHGASEIREPSLEAIDRVIMEKLTTMEGSKIDEYNNGDQAKKQKMKTDIYKSIIGQLKGSASDFYRGHAPEIVEQAINEKSLEGILGNENGRKLVQTVIDKDGAEIIGSYDLVKMVNSYSSNQDQKKKEPILALASEKYVAQAAKNEEERQIAKYGGVIDNNKVQLARNIAGIVLGGGIVNDETVKKYAFMQIGYADPSSAKSDTQDKAITVTRDAFVNLAHSDNPKIFDAAQDTIYNSLEAAA